jgi:ABC-2 type transport system permease protein
MKVDTGKLLSPAEIHKRIDLRPEGNHYLRELLSGDRRTLLRTYDDIFLVPNETEIAAAFKRLTQTPPLIAFITGHGQRRIYQNDVRDYSITVSAPGNRSSLVNQGFDVASIDITHSTAPPRTVALVTADPTNVLDDRSVSQIESYINSGGNLLLAGEPGRSSIHRSLAGKLGVDIGTDTLSANDMNLPAGFRIARYSNAADTLVPAFAQVNEKASAVLLPGTTRVRCLTVSPFHATPLLLCGTDTVALALTRIVAGKEQRIVVCGDADFMSNATNARSAIPNENADFISRLFRWLGNDEFPVDTHRPVLTQQLRMGPADMGWIRLVYSWIFPGLFLLMGACLLLYRMRQ